MRNINIFLLLFALLVFTQCTKSEQFTTQFEGKYIGTFTGEWEKTTIKNFKTAPDTIYSSGQYKYENLTLTIKNLDFEMTSSTIGGFGTFSIKGDSIISFIDLSLQSEACRTIIDCASFIQGNWRYEISKSGLRLTYTYDEWERHNNIDKEVWKSKNGYELQKVN